MNRVKGNLSDEFHHESTEGIDAVLERMWVALGKPAGSYAQAFDVSENTLKTWKRRGAVPLRFLEGFARQHGLVLDVLLGREVHFESEPALGRGLRAKHAKVSEDERRHFAQVMGRLRAKFGAGKDDDVARALGIEPGAFAVMKETCSIPYDEIIDIADDRCLDLGWVFSKGEAKAPDSKYKEREQETGHVAQDFVMVPRYDVHGSAGHGAITHSEQVVDHLAFRGEWVRNALGVSQKDLALISVKGDSMEPTLSNEDLILIDMRKGCVEDNAIYVLQHNGDLLVKRIQRKLDGSVVVKSDNPRYDPETLNPEMAGRLVVVGRVVWSGRRM